MALASRRTVPADLNDVLAKVEAGERLSLEDGVRLWQHPNLNAVGHMANLVRERLHGARTYFVRNQHVNYTNICNKFCKFCSFYAKKGGPDPYETSSQVFVWARCAQPRTSKAIACNPIALLTCQPNMGTGND